jgi:hypothetical protein
MPDYTDLDALGEIYPGSGGDGDRLKSALRDLGFDPGVWWKRKFHELERTFEYRDWTREDIARRLMEICMEALNYKVSPKPPG